MGSPLIVDIHAAKAGAAGDPSHLPKIVPYTVASLPQAPEFIEAQSACNMTYECKGSRSGFPGMHHCRQARSNYAAETGSHQQFIAQRIRQQSLEGNCVSRITIRTTIILMLALMASLISVITRQALIDCGGSSIKAENAATAINCLFIPAHLGDTDAQEMLGAIYAYGIGTAPDFELAKKWLSKLKGTSNNPRLSMNPAAER